VTVLSEEFRHPTQVSRVRLNVYQQPQGFLVTEERLGSATVVATLGLVGSREDALELVRERAGSLRLQRYQRVEEAEA